MTDSPAAAPGWYPEQPGSPVQRWWDGRQWTAHSYNQRTAIAPDQGSKVTAETPVYNPFIWAIVLSPLVTGALSLLWNVQAYLAATASRSRGSAFSAFSDPGYVIVQLSSFVIYGLVVLLSFFDFRRLGRDGFTRRFHWAWSFFGPLVYVIGRTVQVRREAHKGMLTLWVFIGVTVLVTVVILARVFSAVVALGPTLYQR